MSEEQTPFEFKPTMATSLEVADAYSLPDDQCEPTIEYWSSYDGKWTHTGFYLDIEHAKQNLEGMRKQNSSGRYRLKPKAQG